MHLQDFKTRVLPTKNKLYRFALKLIQNAEEAEDAVQEVFLKIWERREEMHQYKNMEAWCMTLIKNFCLDKIRSKKFKTTMVKMDLQIEDLDHTPYQLLERRENATRINKIINELPEKQRMVIHLREIEGYSYQEISEITGMDLNQVKVSLFRGRENLKRKILNQGKNGLSTNRENPGKILGR